MLEVAQQGHLDPLNNSIEYAVHLFKLTKLNSEIKYVANSVATSYAYPTTADVVQWQRGMLERLDEWETEIPHQGRRDAYIATTCQIRCLTLKMVLLRPSPAISTPPVEMIAACHTAAVRTIRLYEQLYRQDLIIHDWITLHGLRQSQ